MNLLYSLEASVVSALLSSFSFRSLSLISVVMDRLSSTVLSYNVWQSEKNESLILCMCSFFRFFTVVHRKTKDELSRISAPGRRAMYVYAMLS